MVEVTIIDHEEQPTVGIRREIRVDQMQEFFAEIFDDVIRALRDAHVDPQGAPFARYRGRPAETVDIEAGFPVAEPFAGSGELVAGTLPAGRAAEAVHVGPYETLRETYAALEAWLGEHGLHAGDEMWERYDSGPASDPDPATWRTRVVWPVSGPEEEEA
jgi:effector-binding domain-containing protein